MEQLLKRINRMWPALYQSGDWFLLQDNAPSPDTVIEMQFLANRKAAVLQHTPSSPDLVPANYFLFPKLIFSLRGQHFQSTTEFQDAVTRKLNCIQRQALLEGTRKWYEHANKCINLERSYVEVHQ
jgi:hypothetical protein